MPVIHRKQPRDAGFADNALLALAPSNSNNPASPMSDHCGAVTGGVDTIVNRLGRFTTGFGGHLDATLAGRVLSLPTDPEFAGNVGHRTEWSDGPRVEGDTGRVWGYGISRALTTNWHRGNIAGTFAARIIGQWHKSVSASPPLAFSPIYETRIGSGGVGGGTALRTSDANPFLEIRQKASPSNAVRQWSSTIEGGVSGWAGGIIPLRTWWREAYRIRWASGNTGFFECYIDSTGAADGSNFELVFAEYNTATLNFAGDDPYYKFGVYGQATEWAWDDYVIAEQTTETTAEFLALLSLDGGAAPGPPPDPDPEPPLAVDLDIRITSGTNDAIVQRDGTSFTAGALTAEQRVASNAVAASARNVGLYFDLATDASGVPVGAAIGQALLEVVPTDVTRTAFHMTIIAEDTGDPAAMNGTTHRPIRGDLSAVATTEIAFTVDDAGLGPFQFDITTIVQELATSGTINQLFLVLEAASSPDGKIGEITSYDSDPDTAPRLMINFEPTEMLTNAVQGTATAEAGAPDVVIDSTITIEVPTATAVAGTLNPPVSPLVGAGSTLGPRITIDAETAAPITVRAT